MELMDMSCYTPVSTQREEKPKNYGVDISTLVRLIEEGKV
jgi:hypothetical protein